MTMPAIAQVLAQRRHFLVAFSGGLDSTVLLHQLVCWREREPAVKLRAIHIHHGLSADADSWVEHCEKICRQWRVPLLVERVTLEAQGLGVEAHARQARYQALRAALQPGEALVTAQHLDDQSETFLLALKRGSGPAGLSAMPVVSAPGGSPLLRPLLNVPRASLLDWARQYDLCWIEDASNQDDAWERNFLRLKVLPLLNRRWPCFARSVARSAALCADQEHLLDELLAEELAKLVSVDGALEIAPLRNISGNRRAALLRRWLASRSAPMPSQDRLARIWREVALAREDAAPVLRSGSHEIRRYQGRLWWLKTQAAQGNTRLRWVDRCVPLILPDALGSLKLRKGGELRAPRAEERITIRFNAPGILHIVGRAGGRKLKKIWQELGVAPWRRNTTPLLFYDETLIAAADLFITREGVVTKGTGLRLEWDKNGQ